MKIEHTNFHDLDLEINVKPAYDGLMLTATYKAEGLCHLAPFLDIHSWSDEGKVLHLCVHHLEFDGFEKEPDGNDMISLTAEGEFEQAMISDSRQFVCNNQILMIPLEVK